MGSLPPSTQPPSSNLPTTAMPLISPSALLAAHLSQSPPRRPSGRTPTQPRPISLNTSSLTHAHGSSIVKIGSSTLVCGVRGEILPIAEIPSWSVKDSITRTTEEWEAAEAADEKQYEDQDQDRNNLPNEDALWQHNLLVPNLSLDTGCSPLHPANTAPSIEQQSLSQRLLSLLLTSKLVRLRDLEIYQHHQNPSAESSASSDDAMNLDDASSSSQPQRTLKAFWTLYIDILCISHSGSGSVFDAAWLALSAALRSTVLPHAEWDADLGRVVCYAPGQAGREERRLRLRGMPVGLSWGIFCPEEARGGKSGSGGGALLVDLDTGEEEVCQEQGCVVVDVDVNGETTLLRVEKSGGAVAGAEELQQVVKAAEGRWREWSGLTKAVR